jgi:hypothetical protein
MVGYLACFAGVSLVCLGFAEAWRDFIVSYHVVIHRGANHKTKPKIAPRAFFQAASSSRYTYPGLTHSQAIR